MNYENNTEIFYKIIAIYSIRIFQNKNYLLINDQLVNVYSSATNNNINIV
jgi:hypothetical protein